MKAILICGGMLSAAFLREFTEKAGEALLFAVDGGLTVLHEAGMCPDYLVGDFDTVKPELVELYESKCRVFRHPPEKDATDTQLAVDTALELGAKEIYLLGATGSRLDHTLANVHMLYRVLTNHGVACIVDENNKITLHDRPFKKKREDLFGNYVSFLPFFGDVDRVVINGMKYSLHGECLSAGISLGISNEVLEEQIEVSFKKGYLLMIEARD